VASPRGIPQKREASDSVASLPSRNNASMREGWVYPPGATSERELRRSYLPRARLNRDKTSRL
jgi:hypothetical protein